VKENAINNLATEVFIDELECLRRVHLSRRTWFSWRRAGKVPSIKLGRRTLYHWPSVEAALLRMQRGGVMVFLFIFVALASQAMGHTSILGFSPEAPAATSAARNRPVEKIRTGQIAQNEKEVTAQ
jgi:hypothetical protein